MTCTDPLAELINGYFYGRVIYITFLENVAEDG